MRVLNITEISAVNGGFSLRQCSASLGFALVGSLGLALAKIDTMDCQEPLEIKIWRQIAGATICILGFTLSGAALGIKK